MEAETVLEEEWGRSSEWVETELRGRGRFGAERLGSAMQPGDWN